MLSLVFHQNTELLLHFSKVCWKLVSMFPNAYWKLFKDDLYYFPESYKAPKRFPKTTRYLNQNLENK